MADEYANSSHTLAELEKTIELTLDPNKGLEKFGYCFKGSILLSKGTNDYTELDSYNSPNHLGLYFLYRQVEPALVGFLKIYWTWGGTIVQELESFKMSGAATAMQHTTIMVRWKYTTGSWSEWKSYQNSFIGSDKILGGNWTDEDVAPSLKEFLKETAHKKIIEWSGIFRDDDDIIIEESSSINVVPSEIIFSTKLNQFIVYKDGLFFNSWMNKDDTSGNNGQSYFTDEKGFTKNIFKALDGSLWVATSEDTIEKVSSGTVSSSGPVVVRWSGIVVDDVAVLNDMTVAPGAELPSDPENIVFIKAKRTFAYRAYDSFTHNYTYYKKFGNFELYQKNTYTEIEFIAEFTDNIFKDTNGHVWVADSAINIIKLIGDAPEDDKTYGRSGGYWKEISQSGSNKKTLPDNFKNLRSKNVGDDVSDCLGDNFSQIYDWYANLTYGPGGETYNVKVDVTYIYLNSPERYSISYSLFNTLYTFVINASNKTLMEKNIIDIEDTNSLYFLPGDITTLSTNSTSEEIEAVLGSWNDLSTALENNKIIAFRTSEDVTAGYSLLSAEFNLKNETLTFYCTLSNAYFRIVIGFDNNIHVETFEVGLLSTTNIVTWDNSSNLNKYKEAGIYYIEGTHSNSGDNMPITAYANGVIGATLIVSKSPTDYTVNEYIISQNLTLGNRVGGETKQYIRSCIVKNGAETWGAWKEVNTLQMFGAKSSGIATKADIDAAIDNGQYAGVYMDADGFLPQGATFTLTVINNYAATSAASLPSNYRQVTQMFIYTPLSKNGSINKSVVCKRDGIGGSSITWGKLESVGGNSESPIYTIGDIFTLTTSSTHEQIAAILGSVDDFESALYAGKLFVCKWGACSAPVSIQEYNDAVFIRVVYTDMKYYPNRGDCIDIHFYKSNNEWKVTQKTLKTITTTNA